MKEAGIFPRSLSTGRGRRSPAEHAVQREFSGLSRTWSAARLRREARATWEVVKWLEPRPSDRVLDAACGPGILGRVLARRVRCAFGVDLCRAMIVRGRALADFHHPPSFAVGNVAWLPFRASSFDLVTCCYAFANFPDPLGVLREFARVARPHGRIAIIDVLAPAAQARRDYLNRLERLRGSIPTKILAADEFRALFQQAGLAVIAKRFLRLERTCRDWLRQSPAAREPERARLLRRLVADSIAGDRGGLGPRRLPSGVVFHHEVAWFLLRKQHAP